MEKRNIQACREQEFVQIGRLIDHKRVDARILIIMHGRVDVPHMQQAVMHIVIDSIHWVKQVEEGQDQGRGLS